MEVCFLMDIKNMGNKTDEFFPKEIMFKEEIVKGRNGDKVVKVKDLERLSEIFLSKVNEGYDMISIEASELLDVDRDWLLNNFRNEFNYFIVPNGVVGHALNKSKSDKFVSDICKKYNIEDKEARYALQFKRMFIERKSFYEFIFKYLKVTESTSIVTIDNEEVNKLPISTLTILKKEFLVKNQMATIDKRTNKLKHTPFRRYEDLTQDIFDIILNHKYSIFENRGLKSGATIKDEMLLFYRERNRLLMVSNEQLNRKLDDELGLIKFSIKREENERHVVRYFLKAPVTQQLNKDKFSFAVSAKYDDKLDKIEQWFTAYVLNYIKEQEEKKKPKRKKKEQ